MDQKILKSQLITEISTENNLTAAEVKLVVDALINKIKYHVCEGDIVTLHGYGRIYAKLSKCRAFRKINSPDWVYLPQRILPKTKFSKKFIERVKG